MRKPPEGSPPQVRPDYSRVRAGERTIQLVTQKRRYRLITPLFGGGAEPGKADPVTIVRGSEVRGQLRFWWRACRGGKFGGDLKRMKEAEDEIWGAASTPEKPRPSKVQIYVEVANEGKEEEPFKLVERKGKKRPVLSENWSILAYAAFPLRGEEKKPPGKVRGGVEFTLTITFPEQCRDDVEAALWAWETFGGIGARTRRGFGALQLVEVDGKRVQPPDPKGAEEFIRSKLRKHVVPGKWPKGVPHLSHDVRLKVTSPFPSPREAWEHLIGCLKKFRQSRPSTAPRQWGRSLWPEPDQIRRLTKRCAPGHKPRSDVEKFPRAALGLPIIFHFKDKGDPADTKLEGKDHDRLASPLILRPLACRGGWAVGLALVLEGAGLGPFLEEDKLVLKGAPGEPEVEATLSPEEARRIPPLRGETDVLKAFFAFLEACEREGRKR